MTSHGSGKQKTAVKIENIWLCVPLDAKIHLTQNLPKLFFRYNNSVSDKYYLCFKTCLYTWVIRCQIYAQIVLVDK